MAKKELHPKYCEEAKVTCACGNTFTTGSTEPEIRVEICHKCHPFFTGQERFVDIEGRVEKFEKKRERAKATEAKKKVDEVKEKERETRPRSLKELLKKVP